MGCFYASLVLKGVTQAQAIAALRGRNAAASRNFGDVVVVLDYEYDQQHLDNMQVLACDLSAALNCVAFGTLVHDDDVLVYFAYDRGTLADSYNSAPDYFDFDSVSLPRGPEGGNAATLCKLLGVAAAQEVEKILRRRKYTFESDRHLALVRALQLPEFIVGMALASLDQDEVPSGVSAEDFLRAADAPPLETPEQREDRRFYDSLGAEDATSPCRHSGCTRGSIAVSVFCRVHQFESVRGSPCPFQH